MRQRGRQIIEEAQSFNQFSLGLSSSNKNVNVETRVASIGEKADIASAQSRKKRFLLKKQRSINLRNAQAQSRAASSITDNQSPPKRHMAQHRRLSPDQLLHAAKSAIRRGGGEIIQPVMFQPKVSLSATAPKARIRIHVQSAMVMVQVILIEQCPKRMWTALTLCC